MATDADLYVHHTDIEHALDIAASDLRALRRVVRADLGAVPGAKTAHGRLPTSYPLKRVLSYLNRIADVLTPDAELHLRKSAHALGGAR